MQGSDPSQNNKKIQQCYIGSWCKVIFNTPCSPDLNPIENVFENVKAHLCINVIESYITHETFAKFLERIKTTWLYYSTEIIDKTTSPMNKRVHLVIKAKGKLFLYI